jgi:hypothetical protein
MRNRGSNVAAWQARLGARQLRAHEALAELERAQRVFIESRTRALSRKRRSRETSERDKMNDGGPELGLKAKGN